ncbi:MAG: Ig-like domain-containing protein [Clostridiales bacterium]|nr:Ig-like domain-containing protein [Clostridiales bacterium]
MKKCFAFVAALIVITVLGVTMFVHAGDMPVIPLTGVTTTAEVSSDTSDPGENESTHHYAAALEISKTSLRMSYRSTAKLTANYHVRWSSDNEDVVTVDDEGILTAVGRGEATITARKSDGQTAICSVKVRYSFMQWFIYIFLFGWIWYK